MRAGRAGEQQPFLRRQESIPGTRERPVPTSPLWVPACAGTTTPHRLSCESRNPSLGRGRGPAPPLLSGYPLARARRHPTVFPAKAGIHPWDGGGGTPAPFRSCPSTGSGRTGGWRPFMAPSRPFVVSLSNHASGHTPRRSVRILRQAQDERNHGTSLVRPPLARSW